ncbi:MAG: heterodisulfide reductase-related iron-sulfur binding cluster, partial [Dehalococcoidales bacterium]|nr:heterodisulfide reductase-related iron-sulfur binding cluster [Dehalococcoidales bacterium]
HLLRMAGAEPLNWSYKTECCGASLSLSETKLALQMSARILANAVEVGADAVVVACPLCQANLDGRQPQINSQLGQDFHLPVLYFTQALGLAFGKKPKELGLGKHTVSTDELLARKGLQ